MFLKKIISIIFNLKSYVSKKTIISDFDRLIKNIEKYKQDVGDCYEDIALVILYLKDFFIKREDINDELLLNVLRSIINLYRNIDKSNDGLDDRIADILSYNLKNLISKK